MDNNYWNSFSRKYTDNVLQIVERDLKEVFKKELNALANPRLKVADLGCGPGSLLKHLAPRFKKVYAVDFAEDLLKLAQTTNPFSNIEYLCHDFHTKKGFPFKADISFCVNALINPAYKKRLAMLRSVRRATKPSGKSIFIVPAYESIIYVYQAMIRVDMRYGASRTKGVKVMDRLFQKDVFSAVDAIVNIGGTPTKCFTREELAVFLSENGYKVIDIKKIEYSWEEEADNPPKWLGNPYPWDWMIVAQKVEKR